MDTQQPFALPSPDVLRGLDEVHERSFRRFCDERNLDDRRRASTALEKLQGALKEDEPPDYDEPYVAAAYLLGYHLSHCMMAYWSFRLLFDRVEVPDALYVCDVGAGTGAARVGLSLALSQCKESPCTIYFDSIEPSSRMCAAGSTFWNAFRCRRVIQPVSLVYRNREGADVPERFPGGFQGDVLRVVAAFYLSLPYDEPSGNVGDAERSLQSALRLVHPDFGVFTCHSDKELSLTQALGAPDRWDDILFDDIRSNRDAEVDPSRLHTQCEEEFGFRVTERWSRRRFRPPPSSHLRISKRVAPPLLPF